MMSGSDDRSAAIEREITAFRFRSLHPALRFGTASDRYAGWIGQIYPEALDDQVTTRRKRLGRVSFEERLVPVSSAKHYFEHFSVLELDFTYYRPLRDADGSPTSSLNSIRQYLEFVPDDALFILKVPRLFFSRRLRTTSGGKPVYVDNTDYLSADAYLRMFHEPAAEVLGSRLCGLVFEQEYQRKSDTPEVDRYIEELDQFFAQLPRDAQTHIEIRSEHLLQPAYFDWLETCGIGFVFSHWTWLPPLRKQWELCGARFTAANGEAIARLMTPLRVSYEKAYAQTTPFDKTNSDIASSNQARRMVDDTAALAFRAIDSGKTLNIVANNRAWGNAPELSAAIADRIVTEMRRRAQERP